MAVIIRLKRMGTKKKPIYRIIATDSRNARDGGRNIDIVGHYDPSKTENQVSFDKEKVDQWIKTGAQVSDTVRSLLKKQGIARH